MLGPLPFFSLLASSQVVRATTAYEAPLTAIGSSAFSSGCSTTGPTSCQNTSAVTDLCCFQSPGGMLMQVQLWDTDPSEGPVDSWTIHGLWPDDCNGNYQEDCDPSRDYDNITQLLETQGATSTLDFMETYWLSDDESAEDFWQHEWATHGTCMNTLDPSCLPSGSPVGADAVAFFETVVKLFQTLPTYSWLESQGITPSEDETYTLDELSQALQTASGGYIPEIDCDNDELYQIAWYFNVIGSVADGTFVPINTVDTGSCPSSGIKYLPKSGDSSRSQSYRSVEDL